MRLTLLHFVYGAYNILTETRNRYTLKVFKNQFIQLIYLTITKQPVTFTSNIILIKPLRNIFLVSFISFLRNIG